MESLVNHLVAEVALFGRLGYGLTAALVMLASAFLVLNFFGLMGGFFTFLERKVAGWTNSRRGPNRVGPYGLAQFVADGVKLVLKEDIIPAAADKPFFRFAPYPCLLGAALSFVAIPFGPKLIISDLNVGVFYLMATGAFTVIGLLMAGWASSNKWALLGGMRSVAQIVSYEIPYGLAILLVVLLAGTMSIQGIIRAQAGGLLNWHIFASPFAFIAFFIYFISSVAEINRIPFDIPEAESELVAGYNIEYSAMRFGAFFAAEFGNIYVVSAIAVTCFLGGWHVPLVDNVETLAPLGQRVGQYLTGPLPLGVILAVAAAQAAAGVYCLLGFIRDFSLKREFIGSRHVRINSEALLLAVGFLGLSLGGVAHLPLRSLLPSIYSALFAHLLPFLVFFTKSMILCFVILWWRWTLPRLRVDQLMGVCWKYLIPIAFFCFIGQGVWMVISGRGI